MIVAVLAVVFLVSGVSTSDYCGGRLTVSSNGLCYLVKEGNATWDQSHEFCRENNMTMASMETEDVFNGLLEMGQYLGACRRS